MTSEVFDEDYFMRGPETNKSLYTSYSWKPQLTIPMCEKIVFHCGIKRGITNPSGDSILDFGCARGYTVKALRYMGYDAWGMDLSEWAIQNCDEEVKPYVSLASKGLVALDREYDWIIAKDVLEHVHYVRNAITELMSKAKCGLFVVVPLSNFDHCPYTIPEYEKDITHCQRYTLASWVEMFLRPGWRVEASYRVEGIKQNYSQFATGNGFIVCRRISK